MENKYNQHTVLLTKLSDALPYLHFQTISHLHVCSAHYNALMVKQQRECKYTFA